MCNVQYGTIHYIKSQFTKTQNTNVKYILVHYTTLHCSVQLGKPNVLKKIFLYLEYKRIQRVEEGETKTDVIYYKGIKM